MLFKVRVGKSTTIGNFRDNNEDRLFVAEDHFLYMVADGMGGQAAGEQASQLAVDIIPRRLEGLSVDCEDPEEVKAALSQAVIAANETILAQGIADPSVQNMGTTVVLALLRGNTMYIAHVGDSRAYRLQNGNISSVTTDHNLAQALFDANTISKEELRTHRFRHVLWKYLGSKEAEDGPDITTFDIQPGQRLLLTTDGLCGVVEDEKIDDVISAAADPQRCAETLVQMALDEGSKDNVTCVVIYIQPA